MFATLAPTDRDAFYSARRLTGSSSVDGLLWLWGVAMREGYYPSHQPADPDRPRLAVVYTPRPPCPDYLTDLSRAFAALHPATRHLGHTAGIAWFAHTRDVSRWQLVIYLYYVESLGSLRARDDFRRLSPERRDQWLELLRTHPSVYALETAEGDALVAQRIANLRRPGHISRNRACELRHEAIARMARFLRDGA